MEQITIKYQEQHKTLALLDSGQVLMDPVQTSPLDLFATALGGCTLTLISMEATRQKIDLKGSYIVVKKKINKALAQKFEEISIEFYCPHRFSLDVEEALEKAGSLCPVHHSIHPSIKQVFKFVFGAR